MRIIFLLNPAFDSLNHPLFVPSKLWGCSRVHGRCSQLSWIIFFNKASHFWHQSSCPLHYGICVKFAVRSHPTCCLHLSKGYTSRTIALIWSQFPPPLVGPLVLLLYATVWTTHNRVSVGILPQSPVNHFNSATNPCHHAIVGNLPHSQPHSIDSSVPQKSKWSFLSTSAFLL